MTKKNICAMWQCTLRYFLFLREGMRDLTKAVRADQVRSESGDDGTHPQSRPPVRCSGAAVSEALTPVRN